MISKYIRLSVDDGITESLSIANQHILLDAHIDDLQIPNATVIEFVDNGYTGTNMERPALQEMLSLVRSGRVNCIVVKDFSRFSRNALESGYYIEQVFPLYRIRFISVSDRFDSNNYINDTGGIDVAFKFLMHEYYSQDLSKKVTSAKRIKMKRGENIVATAIYGYRKSEAGKWEPEPRSADVVRKIYDLALQGLPSSIIRDRLFEAGYPTPREHIELMRGKKISPKCYWETRKVKEILRNDQYIGTYVSGKQIPKAVGSSSKITTPQSEWIKIPNNHPPIISQEIFEKVQVLLNARMANKSDFRKKNKTPRNYLLRGKVRCGCCDTAMSYDPIANPVFRCYKTAADPAASCHKLKIVAAELDDAVMTIIRKQAEVIPTGNTRQISDYELQMKSLMEQRKLHYEQFIAREIDRQTFLSLKSSCTAQIERLSNRPAGQRTAILETMPSGTITAEIVDMFIEKIHVFPNNHIEITPKVSFLSFA